MYRLMKSVRNYRKTILDQQRERTIYNKTIEKLLKDDSRIKREKEYYFIKPAATTERQFQNKQRERTIQ